MKNTTIAWLTVALILCLVALALPGQAAPTPADTVQVSTTAPLSAQKSIPVAALKGSSFTLTLPANHTTGYQWKLGKLSSGGVLQVVGSVYNTPDSVLLGQGGTETWTCKALKPGNATLTLIYVRPWEKNTPPVKTQTFSVLVKG